MPQPGEQLGHYQIVRLLGAGGMGAVFDVEDLDSGRRVALKVLSQTLDSPEARERFFREGRLAASINHPNSVYVFGTEEIGGTPVIAMERVAGGTLQDRVRDTGPLPVGAAVDSVLQIIAGLEAAQRVGVLHRDVKPSNCFVDADGTIKIGDYGLSISSAIRTEPALTATGAFLGTPAFSSPEQLRGDELNVCSDMYSVGATLFFLLTGRTPFESQNTVQLLATVLEQGAPSPRKFRASIPEGLARVVLRCLEKLPGERFRTYEDLGRALAPYSSKAPTPATLGLRFLAGLLDLLLINAAILAILLPVLGNPMDLLNLAYQRSPAALACVLGIALLAVLYYALIEGLQGASIGKAICRLRVVGPDRGPPGLLRALLRAVIYVVAPALPFWIVYGGDPRAYLNAPTVAQQLMGLSFYLVLAVIFCTVRRRNGFAAMHDLVTRTRVISRLALKPRPTLVTAEMPPPAAYTGPTVGPYQVLETLEELADAKWLLAYDLRLLRKVWVRTAPAGAPPLGPHVRALNRVGRLRWLAGRRSLEESWDAFEALTGRALIRWIEGRQPWEQVRFWLRDLAGELSAAEGDGTLPAVLALDRVWITADGRAKLLDFPAPGVLPIGDGRAAPASPDSLPPGRRIAEARAFLNEVARAALEGRPEAGDANRSELAVPIPLHARKFLRFVSTLAHLEDIAAALTPLLQRVAVVSRGRRLAVVAACAAFPTLAGIGMAFGVQMFDRLQRDQPGILELSSVLGQRAAMRSWWMRRNAGLEDRLVAIYVAHHFRSVITNANTWSNAFVLSLIKGESRRFAEQSVADHSHPTEQEIQEADTALKPYVATSPPLGFLHESWFPLVVVGAGLLVYVGFPALACALLFRGGLVLWALGVVIVRSDGGRASRLRVFWRALIAWSPVALAPVWLAMLITVAEPFASAVLATVLVGSLAVLSLAFPDRGLQDRLAGTWLVPR
ncbi:MAG: protein kinase [Verrucomicrobia bacterium]|nr:protein kinase [Verrucomicrobiota bacterium]